MNITMQEHEGCFAFDMVAETMADAALLTRFSTNVTNELRSAGAHAHKDGAFTCHCVLGKHRKANSDIVRRK